MTPPATFALPDPTRATVAIPAPGEGPGYWAGGPSAAVDADGTVWLAYRLRRPVGAGRGYAVGIAHSTDGGVTFTEAQRIERTEFACDSLERPSLVRRPDGGWRLYLSLATPGTLHWYVIALDADRPDDFNPRLATVAFQDAPHRALKDTVIHAGPNGWEAWVCLHQVGDPAEADAMTTLRATSADGLHWEFHGEVLGPADPAGWDRRGTRVAAVAGDGNGGRLAFYDGRASYAENWEERTGLAVEQPDGTLVAQPGGPHLVSPEGTGGLRYLDVLDLPEGRRYYYELARADGSHDLVTELVSH